MSSHDQLSAASNDRKSRLAQLKSLKRKQAPEDTQSNDSTTTTASPPSVTTTYLSGRNFDPSTRNVRLGFNDPPTLTATSTLEHQAATLALQTKAAQAQDDAEAPLDLFRLQPKKANWDLKRDLQDKMREGGWRGGSRGRW
ncbi:hypothetical protein EKO04_008120 [Ascochyta lentis]|uniref:Pre-mRNA-splicing factor cwf18 n=1 Tax=Ascochyta lentis TaxID=205686 RepID=A0A8H7J0S2_9PLEO|nr:hypothetical protein EKO04_008120 [Ascochyta lentis]